MSDPKPPARNPASRAMDRIFETKGAPNTRTNLFATRRIAFIFTWLCLVAALVMGSIWFGNYAHHDFQDKCINGKNITITSTPPPPMKAAQNDVYDKTYEISRLILTFVILVAFSVFSMFVNFATRYCCPVGITSGHRAARDTLSVLSVLGNMAMFAALVIAFVVYSDVYPRGVNHLDNNWRIGMCNSDMDKTWKTQVEFAWFEASVWLVFISGILYTYIFVIELVLGMGMQKKSGFLGYATWYGYCTHYETGEEKERDMFLRNRVDRMP